MNAHRQTDLALAALAPRAVRNQDSARLAAMIASCYADYPGCILDIETEETDLKAPASDIATLGGDWWVIEDGAAIVASAAWYPLAPQIAEVKKLYVARSHRGRGLAKGLLAMIERAALARGAHQIGLWTDTRFREAHGLYEAAGYRRGVTRRHEDLSRTVEYRYEKLLEARAGNSAADPGLGREVSHAPD